MLIYHFAKVQGEVELDSHRVEVENDVNYPRDHNQGRNSHFYGVDTKAEFYSPANQFREHHRDLDN